MGCFVKFLIGLVSLIVVLLALAFGLIWFVEAKGVDQFAKALSKETGYPITVEDSELKLTDLFVRLDGTTIGNPPELFDIPEMIVIKQFLVDVNEEDSEISVSGINRVVVEQVVLDIEQISVLTNKDGVNNFKELSDRIDEAMASGQTAPQPEEQPSEAGEPLDYLIRDLKLRIGSVRFKDDSGRIPYVGQQDQVKEVNYTLELKDVTDLESVYRQVLNELSRRGLQEAMPYLRNSMNDLLDDAGVEEGVRGQLEQGLQNLFEKRAE
ncbi:MAG: hypothetical protein Q7P63_09515 [Verrucomicrobiota bacterium JB022]|nr:hypothetical protein [Verrucomicrobiota bacterium JB022]